MKKILCISTGGTIASLKTDDGLVPTMTGNELGQKVPELNSICNVDFMQSFNMDSTNIRPGHWIKIAEDIKANYDKYDGFVITHGTDTMAYTASGLSYIIQNSPKPIVLTGSQKSLAEEYTDAKINLIDAFSYACSDKSNGVQIVFSNAVINGTRARKNYAKRFMAFGSINYPVIARVRDGKIIRFITREIKGEPIFADYIDPNVGLLKLIPGMRNDVMRFAIDKYDGLVIESFGVGGLPEYSDFFEQIKHAVDNGKLIVMTTQVPNEGSDLSIYHVGKVLKNKTKILEAYDMTSESALAKLMWILGRTNKFEEAEKMFYTTVYDDILSV